MAHTMAQPDPRTPANARRSRLDDIRATRQGVRSVANAVETPALLPLIADAMRLVGLSQKAFALQAEQPESVISEALAGRRHFAIEWLWKQDGVFLLRFFAMVMDARQLTPENISAIRRQRIVELVDLLLMECA